MLTKLVSIRCKTSFFFVDKNFIIFFLGYNSFCLFNNSIIQFRHIGPTPTQSFFFFYYYPVHKSTVLKNLPEGLLHQLTTKCLVFKLFLNCLSIYAVAQKLLDNHLSIPLSTVFKYFRDENCSIKSGKSCFRSTWSIKFTRPYQF